MLDKNDIQILRQMFVEFKTDFKVEIRDEMRALLRIQKKEIIADLTDFMSEQILPQIDDHESRLIRLEQHAV